MGQRNVFPPEVAQLIKQLAANTDDLEDILNSGISVDDGGQSLTIDTDDGAIQVSISGTSGPTPFGDAIFGQAIGVATNTSSTVVTYNPSAQEAVTGFTGNGESDGKWILYINGNEKASQWTNQAEPNADFYFNNPLEINVGDTVELEIENIGLDSADYDGTILIRP